MSPNPPKHPLLEQLERLVPVRAKAMFGGIGIYSDEIFFAIVADDRLYFKVDDLTRPDYLTHGMDCFKPYGEEMRSYYQVPEIVLDEPLLLRQWALAAIETARRTKKK